MSLKSQDVLTPYREKIDGIDREIMALLKERYGVIREVGHLKAREGLPSVIQERVDEVRENAAKRAAESGLDEEFIRRLYAQLIEHSCNMEEEIIQSLRKRVASR
jgi:4-amino-4-deoxychorismate mutase